MTSALMASTNPERFRALHDRFAAFKIDSPEWVAMHALVALGYADENGMDTDAQFLLRPSTESGQLASAVGSSAPDSADKPSTLPSTKGYEGEARGNLAHGSAPLHPKIWTCKIGVVEDGDLPFGADSPMRKAVERAFEELTGHAPNFTFSGWGGKLDKFEQEAIDRRVS